MYGVDMYYSVKTLLSKNVSISEISRQLGIDRKTVRKIRDKLNEGVIIPRFVKKSILDPYRDKIKEYLLEGLSGVLIHRRLTEEYSIEVSYNCLKKYLKKLRPKGTVYVPLNSSPGFEAQVDFGYIGMFYDEVSNKNVKCWVFCMRLSYSRYDYYEIVTSQDIPTFLNCHIHAFEYFGGVPETIKIDNLKSGVIIANFYESLIQVEYSNMLSHYGSSSIPCRVRRPEEKGKVESGIKYVKNNFVKGLTNRNLSEAKRKLKEWRDNICNIRIHGVTKKIPYEEYINVEKSKLKPLPTERYELLEVDRRKVNNYGHITYRNNYYSVPEKYKCEEVHIRSNGKLLWILDSELDEIAVHSILRGIGNFITQPSHNCRVLEDDKIYFNEVSNYGSNIYKFCMEIKANKKSQYVRIIQGISTLCKKYGNVVVDLACKRGIEHNALSYLSIKRICEMGLYQEDVAPTESVLTGGYGNSLKEYDVLTGGR